MSAFEPVPPDRRASAAAAPGSRLRRRALRLLLPPGVAADALRLLLARALRAFVDGCVAVLLPAYLLALGLGTFEVGLVATATLLGSALATLAVGAWGHRCATRTAAARRGAADGGDRRRLRRRRVVLAAAAGRVRRHAQSERRATSASSCRSSTRALPAAASGAGAHRAVRPLQPRPVARRGARRAGGGSAGLAGGATRGLARSPRCGRCSCCTAPVGVARLAAVPRGCRRSAAARSRRRAAPLGPSRRVVVRLAALFSIDSFAGGLVVNSLLALWLLQRFGLSLAQAGAVLLLGRPAERARRSWPRRWSRSASGC